MAICPACNGLIQLEKRCRACGREMQDTGAISDFYDSYSAYLDSDVFADGYRQHGSGYCLHVLSCRSCGQACYLPVNKVKF